MTQEEIKAASLLPQLYIDKPPEYQAVEVTRENYDLVAEWLRCPKVITERSGGVVWEVTFVKVDAMDAKGEYSDKLAIKFQHEPDAVHYRRQYIVRDEKFTIRLVSHTVLEAKYINIPQEASIIA